MKKIAQDQRRKWILALTGGICVFLGGAVLITPSQIPQGSFENDELLSKLQMESAQYQEMIQELQAALKKQPEPIIVSNDQAVEEALAALHSQHAQEVAALNESLQQSERNYQDQQNRLSKLLEESTLTIRKLEQDLATHQQLVKAREEEARSNHVDRAAFQEMAQQLKNVSIALEQEKSKKSALEIEYQSKLQEEKRLRLAKESLLENMGTHLHEQKAALEKMEQSRLVLVKELDSNRKEYAQLLKELRSATDPASLIAEATAQKKHLVSKGDTLTSLSQHYYGTSKRWNDIYEANKQQIPDINQIRVGTELVIP